MIDNDTCTCGEITVTIDDHPSFRFHGTLGQGITWPLLVFKALFLNHGANSALLISRTFAEHSKGGQVLFTSYGRLPRLSSSNTDLKHGIPIVHLSGKR
jgi:hypothetical protein